MDGQVIYKSKSYNMQLDLHDVTLHAPDDVSRVGIAATGVYNGMPVALTADTRFLRSDARRRKAVRHRPGSAWRRRGDRFQGRHARSAGIRRRRGADHDQCPQARRSDEGLQRRYWRRPCLSPSPAPSSMRGDHWEITGSKGKIATSTFTGDLLFDEGARGHPDNLTAALRFDKLVLAPIIASAPAKSKPPADYSRRLAGPRSRIPARTSTLTLDADQLVLGKGFIGDFGLTGKLVSGQMTLSRLTLAFAGGRIDGYGFRDLGTGRNPYRRAGHDRRRRCRPAGALRPGARRQADGAHRRRLRYRHDRRHAGPCAEGQPRPCGDGHDQRQHRARSDGEAVDQPAEPVPRRRGRGAGRLSAQRRRYAQRRGDRSRRSGCAAMPAR